MVQKNSGLRPDRGYVGHKAAKMMQRSKSIQGRRLRQSKKSKAVKKYRPNRAFKIISTSLPFPPFGIFPKCFYLL